MMQRRDWWFGVAVVALAIVLHAAIPRFEWRHVGGDDSGTWSRVDRWTGEVRLGRFEVTTRHGVIWVAR